jgi:hypothetical protein
MKNNKVNTRQEAIARLKEIIRPGMTVHTILRHRSASGMTRSIDVKLIVAGKEFPHEPVVCHIGYSVAQAIGLAYDETNEGVKVRGFGMDMGYHLVDQLDDVLGGGYKLRQAWL